MTNSWNREAPLYFKTSKSHKSSASILLVNKKLLLFDQNHNWHYYWSFMGPTFCLGLTRANTRMWGKRVWSSWGSQLSLASPSPVTHKSNCCTNVATEGGGSGTRTLPSMDSHCHSPGKQNNIRYMTMYFNYVLSQNTYYKWITTAIFIH